MYSYSKSSHINIQNDKSILFSQELSCGPCPDQDQSVRTIQVFFLSLRLGLILSIHQSFSLSNGLLPSGFPTNNIYAFDFSPIRFTYHVYHFLLDQFIVIILGEVRELRSSSLRSFLQLQQHQLSLSHV